MLVKQLAILWISIIAISLAFVDNDYIFYESNDIYLQPPTLSAVVSLENLEVELQLSGLKHR